MLRSYRSVALSCCFLSASLLSLAGVAAHAESGPKADNIHVNGSYHSVTNGIPNYDGFDRFRDANGNPLPGWEQQLRSQG